MLVIIGVVLDRSTPESFGAFEKAVQKVPGCLECLVVTGEFDYFVTVRTRTTNPSTGCTRRNCCTCPACARSAPSWC